jgi:hypothetical protein
MLKTLQHTIILAWIGYSGILFPYTAFANSCVTALLGMWNRTAGSHNSTSLLQQSNRPQGFLTPTVVVTGLSPGSQGGQIVTLKKIGDRWHSNAHGDPHSFFVILGDRAAQFFGFEKISETELRVPDVAEFNGAINYLNLKYAEAYSRPFTEISYFTNFPRLSSATHLRMWAQHSGIPIGSPTDESTHVFINDISRFTGTILLPSEVVAHTRKISRYTEKFLAFAESQNELSDSMSSEEKSAWKLMVDLIRIQVVNNINAVNGSMAEGILSAIASQDISSLAKPGQFSGKEEGANGNQLVEILRNALSGDNFTPYAVISSAIANSGQGHGMGALNLNWADFKRSEKLMPVSQFDQLFEAFRKKELTEIDSEFFSPAAAWEFDRISGRQLNHRYYLKLIHEIAQRQKWMLETIARVRY